MAKVKRANVKKEYTVLDIDAAMDGKEKVVEQVQEEELETGTKSLSPFDFVKDIRTTKSGTLLDKEQDEKAFTNFMTLRILSMSPYDIDMCNILNQYQATIPKKAMYQTLISLIEKDSTFYKFISTTGMKAPEAVEFIAKYYKVPTSQAEEFVELMGEDWMHAMHDKVGGVVTKTKA